MKIKIPCVRCGEYKNKSDYKENVTECEDCINEKDKQFMNDIQYFWKEKGDLERYTSFDLNRLKRLDWKTANAYINYMQAKESLDYNINNIED